MLFVFFTLQLNAQSEERKWNVGVQGGMEQYNGDLGSGFYKTDQALYGFAGISLSRYLSPHWDIVGNATLGEVGHVENQNRFRVSMLQFNLNARFNFFDYDKVKFRPFLFAGIGNIQFSDKNSSSDENISNIQLPDFGGGLSFKVSPVVNIVLQETFMFTDYDKIDGEVGGINDWFMQHSLGLTFNLGKAKDSDGDGISDKEDICPNLAGLEKFDGCPDSDQDGISDNVDACPNVFGITKFQGCPDSDGDGITDKEDNCPDEKGLKEFNGCPDLDGDGIMDSEDKCPKEKGSKELNGCPDSDGDGIIDDEDQCPDEKGLEKMNGCPDSDGDGVADNVDVCPDVAGIAKNKGCPEIKKEEIKVLKQALNGIKFQSAKAIITKNSYPVLDNVVTIMEINPAYKLKIDGHTDAQGDDDKNMILSEKRANAVKDYLVKKGIKAERLTAEGFGETQPVSDNKTAKGRAENRRVALTIEF